MKISIGGTPLYDRDRPITKGDLSYPDDPEAGPDCIEILPDGRHVEWLGPDEWYEVDPVTNKPNLDQPVDPESIPASLRDNQPLD